MALTRQQMQQLEKGYQQFVKQQNQQKVQQRSGLQKFAPAIGATVAGVAAAPFTGGLSFIPTLAALGAAGAVGSAAGEKFAQQSNRENIDTGAIRHQAVVGGALSAIPLGGVARSTRVATKAATAAPDVALGVGGKLANVGRRLETRSGGFGIGEKLPGRPPMQITTQQNIAATLKQEGIKPGLAENLAVDTQKKLGAYHIQMDKALAANNRALTTRERTSIINDYLKKVNASPTVDSAVRKSANELANNLKGVKDLKGLNQFRRGVDKDAISYIANPDAATAAKTQAAQVLRRHLSDTIGKAAPDLKTINARYTKLSTANDYLTQQAGRLTRQSENPGGGFVGRFLTGDMANATKSKVGAVLQRVSGQAPELQAGARAVAGPITRRAVVGETVKQAGGRPLIEALTGQGAQPMNADQILTEPNLGQPTDTVAGTPAATDQTTPQPITLQDALMQAQTLLGSKQTPATYLAYAKEIMNSSPSGTKAVKKTESQRARDNAALLANKALQQLEAGSVNTGLIGGNLEQAKGIFGKADPETLNFNITVSNLKALIAKANAGTSFTAGEKAMLKQYTPNVGDSGQVLRAKLLALQQMFGTAQQNEYGQEYQPDVQVQGSY